MKPSRDTARQQDAGKPFSVVSVKLQGLLMESFLFSHEQCNRCALAVPGTAHLLSPVLLLCECEDRAARTVLQSWKRHNSVCFHSTRQNQEQDSCVGSMCVSVVCACWFFCCCLKMCTFDTTAGLRVVSECLPWECVWEILYTKGTVLYLILGCFPNPSLKSLAIRTQVKY